jgi:hypothetical protein
MGSTSARAPQLPAFLLPAQPLPAALPRPRKHRPRYATVYLHEAALLAVLAMSVGIAAGSATKISVPSLPPSLEASE